MKIATAEIMKLVGDTAFLAVCSGAGKTLIGMTDEIIVYGRIGDSLNGFGLFIEFQKKHIAVFIFDILIIGDYLMHLMAFALVIFDFAGQNRGGAVMSA